MDWSGTKSMGGPRIQKERPWAAVWRVLLDRAMEREKVPPALRGLWRAVLAAYLEEYRRHPARITAPEIRDFLFRNGELGGARPERSLFTTMDALAFFYARVVPRPTLSHAARHPFEPVAGSDDDLMLLLRERLVENGDSAFLESSDWRAAQP